MGRRRRLETCSLRSESSSRCGADTCTAHSRVSIACGSVYRVSKVVCVCVCVCVCVATTSTRGVVLLQSLELHLQRVLLAG